MKLFHTVATPVQGLSLDWRQAGIPQVEQHLYATPVPAIAACYAIPHGGKYAMNVDDNERIMLVIPESTVDQWFDLTATMYSFASANFVRHPEKAHEWIGEPVALHDVERVMDIKSMSDIMNLGVQIYALPPETDMNFVFHSRHFEEKIEALFLSGKARWLNKESNIHPIARRGVEQASGSDQKTVHELGLMKSSLRA